MTNPGKKEDSTASTLGGLPDHTALTPWKTFLESMPPGKELLISGMTEKFGESIRIATPELHLHCSNDICNGIRYFAATTDGAWFTSEAKDIYLVYVCRNCRRYNKRYAIRVQMDQKLLAHKAIKYGEIPNYGTPTPARTISLIGPDRELFLLGRKCENQGMGIGAFVYYRRVVENQKNRIFDEILRVILKTSPDPELVKDLESAKNETQFSRSIDQIKHGLPQSLMVNGHNPLTLLHSALSEGLHAQSDSECLELATSIRIVLNEFAERSMQALKEEQELNNAITRLMNPKKISSA